MDKISAVTDLAANPYAAFGPLVYMACDTAGMRPPITGLGVNLTPSGTIAVVAKLNNVADIVSDGSLLNAGSPNSVRPGVMMAVLANGGARIRVTDGSGNTNYPQAQLQVPVATGERVALLGTWAEGGVAKVRCKDVEASTSIASLGSFGNAPWEIGQYLTTVLNGTPYMVLIYSEVVSDLAGLERRILADAELFPSEGGRLIFQSDENDFSVGQDHSSGSADQDRSSRGIFDAWGPRVAQFHGERITIENDPAGGRGKCYRVRKPSRSTGDAMIGLDIVAAHHGGNGTAGTGTELQRARFSVEIYFPSTNNPGRGHTVYMLGHTWLVSGHLPITSSNDAPKIGMDITNRRGQPDEFALYCYYVNKADPTFGDLLQTNVVYPLDQWVEVAAEVRDGSGDTSGTLKAFMNGVQVGSWSGQKWHAVAGRGWRHMGFAAYWHEGGDFGQYDCYFRRFKMHDIS